MESTTSRHSIESQTKQTDYVNVIEDVRPSYEEHMSEKNPSQKESFQAGGNSELRDWTTEPSKINYLIRPQRVLPSGFTPSIHSVLRYRKKSTENDSEAEAAAQAAKKVEEQVLKEEFPKHMTSLMNEDNYWGCFYIYPDLYADVFSPVVKIRDIDDVPELVGGELTRDMVTACLTYLKRTPILGDLVFIKLDLSSKHLMKIDVLQHYKFLVYLNLSSNLLTELTVLSHLPYLQFLSVDFNRLGTVLEYTTPQWFLTEVHYKYNSVKRIRDLSGFWSITVLDLSHNNIKAITGLENLKFLRRLDLSFNHIQHLENLNHLRLLWLDVSYNNISCCKFGANAGLWTLLHLEYLNLNENNLTSMKMFSYCTRLRELHLRNNRFSTLLELAVFMSQMRRLLVLDLRANPICSIPGYKSVVINTFSMLLSLDAAELDPVEQRTLMMDVNPDITMHTTRKLLRLIYIQQLSKARISPFIPPADTMDVPIVAIVGHEGVGKGFKLRIARHTTRQTSQLHNVRRVVCCDMLLMIMSTWCGLKPFEIHVKQLRNLSRRLGKECSSHVQLGLRHTTASFHFVDHYIEVTRSKFDDMLLAGDFLTYTETDGESYGLSREEAFVTEGKVKIVCLDLPAALMLKLRGYRPYMILATYMDRKSLSTIQERRKIYRKSTRERLSLETPMERSTLQVLLSGRIIITGIINEIIVSLPDEKEQSEFMIESECSLMMDSEARANKDYSRGYDILALLNSSASSLDEVMKQTQEKGSMEERSLYSLFKESQGTAEYTSDINGQNQGSYQERTAKRSECRPSRQRPVDKHSKQSSISHSHRLVIPDSSKSSNSKSVTFTSQDEHGEVEPDVTGLMVEPAPESNNKEAENQIRSISARIPWQTAQWQSRRGSQVAMDESDLWIAFLTEAGYLQASDINAQLSDTCTPRFSKTEDDTILRQITDTQLPSDTPTTGLTDPYEHVHRKNPGLFWDTVAMDDPEQAFIKMRRIIRDIVNSQNTLKPMFDIDFSNFHDHPTVQRKLTKIRNQIAPHQLFY